MTNVFKSVDEIPSSLIGQFDAILVLGGGVPSNPNLPPAYVQTRCQYAAEVYNKSSSAGSKRPKILALSAGTAHLPQLLSADGLPVWEATATASFLLKELDIPADDVYAETTSYDTISNAFFARTSFCDLVGWKKLLIITSEFHMKRTRYIFDWIMNVPGVNDTALLASQKYELNYLSVPDYGLSEEAVKIRNEKENKSADNVKKILSKKYKTLSEVFEFITGEHSFYNAEKLVDRANTVVNPDDAKKLEMLRQTYGGSISKSSISLGGIGNHDFTPFASGTLFGGVVVAAIILILNKTGANSKNNKVW